MWWLLRQRLQPLVEQYLTFLGEDRYRPPVIHWAIVIQIQEDLAKQARVEIAFCISVALDFNKVDW